MDQRTQFTADYQREVFTVVELADRHEISRKTAYKWIDRYGDGGPAALVDRSRRPKSCPHQTDGEIVEALLALRRHHPTWGPKKLRHVLTKRAPEMCWPARSTIADLLQRHGLITRSRRRPPPVHPGRPETSMTAPNDKPARREPAKDVGSIWRSCGLVFQRRWPRHEESILAHDRK